MCGLVTIRETAPRPLRNVAAGGEHSWGGSSVNKIVRAVARGSVVAVVLLGLASVPAGHPQAATAPQEGEHDVVVNPNPVDATPGVLDGNTQAVIDLGSRVIVGGKFTQVKKYSESTV